MQTGTRMVQVILPVPWVRAHSPAAALCPRACPPSEPLPAHMVAGREGKLHCLTIALRDWWESVDNYPSCLALWSDGSGALTPVAHSANLIIPLYCLSSFPSLSHFLLLTLLFFRTTSTQTWNFVSNSAFGETQTKTDGDNLKYFFKFDQYNLMRF